MFQVIQDFHHIVEIIRYILNLLLFTSVATGHSLEGSMIQLERIYTSLGYTHYSNHLEILLGSADLKIY